MAHREWLCVNQVRPEASNSFDPAQFTLSAAPQTDVYASPLTVPALHVYSAPVIHTRVEKSRFVSTRVTFSFVPTLQFDQGGLIFTIPTKTDSAPQQDNITADVAKHSAWIKAGIEVNDGEAWLSVVGKARNGWCDWSLAPLPGASGMSNKITTTVELQKSKNALMVYAVEAERKVLIRKVPWVFLDDDELGESAYVGAYAARPDPDSQAGGTNLELSFDNLSVVTQ